ncbi:MAG: 30S ribosomal protein S1 [Geobacter sp.]|nr:30S ribosomal protein S1 [Geobacter sp.]
MDTIEKDFDETTEEESFAELFEKSYKTLEKLAPGQKVTARVLKISGDWIFLDTGRKGEGVLDRKELLDDEGNITVKEGDSISVWFVGASGGELRFTTKLGGGPAGSSQLEDAWRSGIPVEGFVEKEIKGGFEVKIGSSRAFCPFSQMGLRRVDDPAGYVGKHLSFRVTDYAENGRNIVLSRRALLEEEQQREKAALREKLQEGMVVEGTVSSLRDFGAFVDIGGIEGLVPMSEMAWGRVKSASEVLSVGQKVRVAIKRLDWENNKISLSLRDTLADPWETMAERLPEGSYHTGTVSQLAQFGAFVTLAEGIDGLIHISRLGQGKRINHPREVLKEGETIEVKVEGVDRENRRISLCLAGPARAAEEEAATMDVFRATSAESSGKSLGSLGDLLKAKMDKKKK